MDAKALLVYHLSAERGLRILYLLVLSEMAGWIVATDQCVNLRRHFRKDPLRWGKTGVMDPVVLDRHGFGNDVHDVLQVIDLP